MYLKHIEKNFLGQNLDSLDTLGQQMEELKLEQYIETFEEEEMTSIELLCDIGGRADGEKELTEALKEMGIKKMGHRQAIVGAVMGK